MHKTNVLSACANRIVEQESILLKTSFRIVQL